MADKILAIYLRDVYNKKTINIIIAEGIL